METDAGARHAAPLHHYDCFTLMKIPRGTVYIAIFLSGFAGLGYEIVWTRMLALTLGNEIAAVLAVLASFFSGLALGAWFLDRVVSTSPRPAIWYALCEGVIGLWALLLALLFPAANRMMHALTGTASSQLQLGFLCFLLPFFLLLPATFAMGVTLPAIDRLLVTLRANGRCVGGLYSANTFGAVAGTMLTTFLLAPWLGSRASLIALAAVNFACAAAVGLLPLKTSPADSAGGKARIGRMDGRLAAILFLTGFLGIGFEVMVVRVLSQVFENTVYSFANILSVYLLGSAIGAALVQRWGSGADFNRFLSHLLTALSASCLLSMLLLSRSEHLYALIRGLLGGGFGGSMAAEAGTAWAVVSLPTVIMGATFAHLAQAARRHDGGVGQALCLNTLGASLAPILLGSMVLPVLGSKSALLLVSLGYLALIPTYGRLRMRWVAALGILTLAVVHPGIQLQLITLRPGDLVLKNVEGVMASVTVIKDAREDIHLKVNNHFQMGGTSSYYSDRRQGHIPLLLHPNPKTALFLGLGTGATFAAAGTHPGLEADGVELVPEIVPLLPYFAKSTGDLARNPRLHVLVADARRFVNATHKTYDVVVADLFHPGRDGAGALYTVEHFSRIRSLLNPGGVFCQWLPLYQLDSDTLRVIVRTFLEVYPQGCAFLAHYSLETPILGLVGSTGERHYSTDWLERRVQNAELARELQELRIDDFYSLLGGFVAGNVDLSAFATGAELNTDDRPVVIDRAPRYTYAGSGLPSDGLFDLLGKVNPRPDEIVVSAKNESQRSPEQRLMSYWAARNGYLRAGAGIARTNDPRELLKAAAPALLDIVRKSSDFAFAYDPLLILAQRLSLVEPTASRHLLVELEQANPLRPDALRLRERLFPGKK